eukprot:299691_1
MTFEIDTLPSAVLYTASIGAIVGSVIATVLLCHLVYHYQILSRKKRFHKTAYILVIIYVSLGCLQVFSLLFIRTNIVTRISADQFTLAQCAIGFILNWFGTFSAVSMLYIIFIHRISMSFHRSAYKYHSNIINTLYFISILFFFVASALRLFAYLSEPNWSLVQPEGFNLYYCRNKVTVSLRPVSITLAIYTITMSAVLTYMFISRLYKVNAMRINYFIEKHRGKSMAEMYDVNNTDNVYMSSDNVGNFSVDVVYDTLSRRSTSTKKRMKYDIKDIFTLHDLIKKQTILVVIAIVSSVTLWALTAWESYFFFEIVWDVSFNTICVWLMLGSSKTYWSCCRKYGFCVFCYCQENTMLDL